MRYLAAFTCGILVACGGGGGDGVLALEDDAGASLSSVSFADTSIGASTTEAVYLVNQSDSRTGTIAVATAGEFTVDDSGTTCSGVALDPGAMCTIGVAFAPIGDGTRTGTLVVTAAPGGTVTVALTGSGFAPSIMLAPASVDFGRLDVGMQAMQTITVSNTGTTPAPLTSTQVAGGGLAMGGSTCGNTLAPGASCDVAVVFAPLSLGAATGTLTVKSGGHDYVAQLAGTGTRSVSVVRAGSGQGTVTSTPAGIDCGSTCTASFPDDVVLTAVADGGSTFAGWSDASCTTATCTVTASTATQTITATFTTGGTGVSLTPSSDDWGVTDMTGSGLVHSFQLTNGTASVVAVDNVFATNDFSINATTCGTSLAAGASCTIDVRFVPTVIGPRTGVLSATAGGSTLISQLAGTGGKPVTVTVQGSGSVTSTPTGITCGTTCSAVFAQQVTLTATPDAGYFLLGWSSATCSGSTCTVPPGTQVTATFGPVGGASLTVHFAGNAAGAVRVYDATQSQQLALCHTLCQVALTGGHSIAIAAATPSRVDGITGVCSASGTPHQCSFTANGMASATVTFSSDPAERWTVLDPSLSPFIGAGFDDVGNLVVVQSDHITKFDTGGNVVWRKTLPSDSFVMASGGAFYVTDSGSLVAIDSAGTITSAHPFAPKLQFVGPSGHLFAIDGANQQSEWDASAQLLRTLGFGPVYGIDANGTFYGLTETHMDVGGDDTSFFSSPRWQNDGTPLTDLPEVAPQTPNADCRGLVVSFGHIVGYACGQQIGMMSPYGYESHALDGTAEVSESVFRQVAAHFLLPGGAAVAGPNTVVSWYGLQNEVYIHGVIVKWQVKGASGWTAGEVDRPVMMYPPGDAAGIETITVVGGPNGDIALIGTYYDLWDYANNLQPTWTLIQTYHP